MPEKIVFKKALDDRHTVIVLRSAPWHGKLVIKDRRKTIFGLPVGLFDFEELGSDFNIEIK
jgi:hypothetical protein